MKRWVEWLMLETGGLFCNFGWHSWERGEVTHWLQMSEEDHGCSVTPHCRWCGVTGDLLRATPPEARRWQEKRWQQDRQVVDYVTKAEAHRERWGEVAERAWVAQGTGEERAPAPRTPAGPSRLQAPNSDRLRRTVALLHDKSTAEVTQEVMAAQCTRTEPLASVDRDLATGAVQGSGPMSGW